MRCLQVMWRVMGRMMGHCPGTGWGLPAAAVCFRFSVTLYLIMGVAFLWGAAPADAARQTILTGQVYAQVERIAAEVALLHKWSGKQEKRRYQANHGMALKPRHVWQKGYAVLVKLNILRQRNGMPRITPNAMEPVLNLEPMLVFEQTQRILTEVALIKRHLDIQEQTTTPEVIPGKRAVDIFNKLHTISLALETIIEEEIDPTHVFAEVMRLDEDVTLFLRQRGIRDSTFPPARLDRVTPADSLKAAFEVISEIQRLHRYAGIDHTNLNGFRKTGTVYPSDVFNMVLLSLAEFQPLKAHFHDSRITPPAEYRHNKRPADVYQLLMWVKRKLRLIDASQISRGSRP